MSHSQKQTAVQQAVNARDGSTQAQFAQQQTGIISRTAQNQNSSSSNSRLRFYGSGHPLTQNTAVTNGNISAL